MSETEHLARMLAEHGQIALTDRGWRCLCGKSLGSLSASLNDQRARHQAEQIAAQHPDTTVVEGDETAALRAEVERLTEANRWLDMQVTAIATERDAAQEHVAYHLRDFRPGADDKATGDLAVDMAAYVGRLKAERNEARDALARVEALDQDTALFARFEGLCQEGASNPSTLADKIQDAMADAIADALWLSQANPSVGGGHIDPERLRALKTAEPCPTCSPPMRETVGMVCQTCGTDYAKDGRP